MPVPRGGRGVPAVLLAHAAFAGPRGAKQGDDSDRRHNVWIAFDHVDGLKRLTVSGATVDGAVGVEGRWARRLPQRSNSEQ